MTESKQISVWVESLEQTSRAALPQFLQTKTTEVVQVGSDVLAENLHDFLTNFEVILTKQPKPVGGYLIDEIELNLTVNANGGVELIGKLGVGVQAAIKIKFRRQST